MKLNSIVAALLFADVNCFSERVRDVRKSFGADRVVKVSHEQLNSNEEITKMLMSGDADHFGLDDDASHFKVDQATVDKLAALDAEFEDSTEHWIGQFEANFNDENFACLEGAACAKRSAQDFYSSYQPLDAIHERITDLAAGSSLATIGSIGSSYEGRDQLTINIGDQSKPLVFYFCNIHAREWLTPMYCTYMAETLLADGGHPLLDDFSFTILASANPDGYAYTWSNDNLWRKTRRPNSGSSCVGTDPNRNYAVNHCGSGSSTNPCDQTYCGNSPLDQAETANIAAFVEANNDRIISVMDVHSYSYMWMYAYGYTTAQPSDQSILNTCSTAAVNAIQDVSGRRWAYGTIANVIYIASGNSVDWFYQDQDILHSYTVELRGTSFQPSAANIIPSNEEMFAGMVANLACVNGDTSGADGGGDDGGDAGCVDDSPSGITVGGVPTECPLLAIYCAGYDFVRENCPFTCGECANQVAVTKTAGVASKAVVELAGSN